jgi:Concanavalin A-like lectin/glucanases superfamily
MTVKRFSTLFCQWVGFVMFASLSVWSSSTFAACGTVTNGLVACYPFEGNANDASGNKNNGTLKGGVTLTTDRFGNADSAYQFDGINGFIEVADNPTLDVGTADYSVGIWVRYEGNESVDRYNVKAVLVDKRDYSTAIPSTVRGYSLYLYPNQFGTQMADDRRWYNFGANAVLPNDGKWHHLVTTIERKNTSGLKLYMDGTLIGTFNPTFFTNSLDSNTTLKIGQTSYPMQVFLKGSVDDVRLYKRALSETEVKQLYNEPNPVACAPANYTNGVLKVPFIAIEGVTDAYKATMQQYNSGFAFRVTESAVITGKSSCPATYSPTTGILHIPLVKTKSAIPLNTFQCYDVTMQAFSDRFQLDLDTLKVVNCP